MKVSAYIVTALLAGTAAAAPQAVDNKAVDTIDSITEALGKAGYSGIREVELDDGVWEAEVRGDDGRYHDVYVVPGTGAILDARSGTPILTAEDIVTRLRAAGYQDFRDLDLDDALWEVEASTAAGDQVELRINGFTGEVLHEQADD